MTRLSTVELHKAHMKFSSGHFTIFSATEREKMHGHNYTVYVALTTELGDDGLSFDYRFYKKRIIALCKTLNGYFLLPTESKYLRIQQSDDYINAEFDGKILPFLKEEVVLLPLTNITVEELSHWFINKLLEDKSTLAHHAIRHILVKVSSAPGQSGSAAIEL